MAPGAGLVVLVHEWVTGGGLAGMPLPAAWERQGRAMRRAIAGEFAGLPGENVKVVMTLDGRLPAEPGPWAVEYIGKGEHGGKVRELSLAADFTVLVAPETRGILAGLTRDLEQAGARMLGSSAEAVDLTGDKARLAIRLHDLGIDTPLTRMIVPSEGLPPLAQYPAVLKPVDGAGSMDTFYLSGAARLPEEARRMPEALLQPFVRGEPMSASFLKSSDGRAWLIGIGRQHIEIRDGRFEYEGGEVPWECPGARAEVERAVEAIEGLFGFVGVDFIWNENRQRATILEINPRPTTSIVGLCRLLPAGHLARAWLEACGPLPRDEELLKGLSTLVQSRGPVVFDEAGDIAEPPGCVN
jgi:predicted ATP-grasp superfamily ATP-dependent carboligase